MNKTIYNDIKKKPKRKDWWFFMKDSSCCCFAKVILDSYQKLIACKKNRIKQLNVELLSMEANRITSDGSDSGVVDYIRQAFNL